ncbi:MAG TPA: UrcA family protein [Caulobacteraceae bacterium]
MNRMNFAASVAAVLALTGSAAHAAPVDPDAVSVKVSVADLNLATRSGASTMFERLKFASKNICGPAPRTIDIQATTAYRACFDQTLAGAVRGLDAPRVSEVFAEFEGRPNTLAMAKLPD